MLGQKRKFSRRTFFNVRTASDTTADSLSQSAGEEYNAARLSVIINASSGAYDKSEVSARLVELFKASGADARVSVAQDGDDITEMARRAAREEASIVVAGGGDGTISAVASALAGTDKIMGVLPLGTLNHFAKDLSIPLDVEEAARVCVSGRVTRVDVGEVNGQVFVNNSSLGLYPSIVRLRDRQRARLGLSKWLAFVWATLSVLRRYPFMSVRLSTDEKKLFRRTPFVFVGNNEYQMEGLSLGARSCLDKGELSLHVAHRTGRLGLLRFALRALLGGLRDEKDFDSICTKEIWVETRRQRLRVALDGEVTIMNTPLHYQVRPGALRVLVPKEIDK